MPTTKSNMKFNSLGLSGEESNSSKRGKIMKILDKGSKRFFGKTSVMPSMEETPEILQAIDRGLDVFGTSVRQSIYFHLEKECGIDRSEILSNPEKLERGLEVLFGSGTQIVLMHIVRKINSEFGVNGTTLTDAIRKAERRNIIVG